MTEPVQARRETYPLVIVPLLPPDPNPALPARGGRAIYPYTRTYRFGREPVERPVESLVVENDLTSLRVVPALGGRLWTAANRLTGEPLFHTPERVGMINFGQRGAWYTGGVEFNFPIGHTVTNNETVPALLRRYPDGSAAAIVGNLNLCQRVTWQVGVRLEPGCSSIFFDVLLNNRSPLPVSYTWWINAGVQVDESLEYVNGTTEVRSHFLGRREHLGEMVPWPLFQGQDFRLYRECREPTSLFQLAGEDRWYGWYRRSVDQGMVRVGPNTDAPGLKFWNSGQAEEGYLWGKHMTCGERYTNTEVQTGRPETQMDYGVLPPHQVLRWTEAWRPVWGLGGLTAASLAVAAHLEAQAGGSALKLLGDRDYPTCTVKVRYGETEQVFSRHLFADHPVAIPLEIPAEAEPLGIEVISAAGETLFDYHRSEDNRRRSVLADVLQMRPGTEKYPAELTAEELALEAERQQRQRYPEAARDLAEKALAIDPGLVRAHLTLARDDLRSARYTAAIEHSRRALWRNPDDEEAHYLLALAELWRGEAGQGELELERLLGHSYLLNAAAWFELAQCRMRRGAWAEARHDLGRCLEREANHVKAKALLATTYRRQSRADEAAEALRSAVDLAPLDPLVRAERWLAGPTTPTPWTEAPAEGGSDLAIDLRTDEWLAQDALEAACDYLACGLADDGARVLTATLARRSDIDPLALYLLGYLQQLQGDETAAAETWRKAGEHGGRYVYAFRREEGLALQAALKYRPEDALAQALLGMLELFRDNPESASACLEQATRLRPGWALPLHLLATAQQQLRHPAEAARWLEQAVTASPQDAALYRELDELLADLPGEEAAREKLWAGVSAGVLDDDFACERYATYLRDAGRPAEAAQALEGHVFFPEEGSSVTRDLWAGCQMDLALEAAQAGRIDEALDCAGLAATYPEDLGLALPFIRYDAPAYVLEAALRRRGGETDLAQGLLEQAAGERHRETNEADFFSGLAYRALGRESDAQAKFSRLMAKAQADLAWPGRDHAFAALLAALGEAGCANQAISPAALEKLTPVMRRKALCCGRIADLLQGEAGEK